MAKLIQTILFQTVQTRGANFECLQEAHVRGHLSASSGPTESGEKGVWRKTARPQGDRSISSLALLALGLANPNNSQNDWPFLGKSETEP